MIFGHVRQPGVQGCPSRGGTVCVALLLAGALLAALPGSAPAAGTADLTELSLEELIDLPVTVASRFAQPMSQAPGFVSVVTSEEIRRYGYRTLADVLRSVRGVYTSGDRQYTYFGARGFLRPGDFNARVLVLVDGQRTNDPVYDSAGIGSEFPVDLDLVDRVEVIRGPGSSVYGTNAFLGIVNVILKRGADYRWGKVSAEAGSFAARKGTATFGHSFRNGAEVLASVAAQRSAGDRSLYFREFDDPSTNHGVAENADRERAHRALAKLGYRDVTLEASFSERTKHDPTAAYGTRFNDDRTRIRDVGYQLDLRFDHAFDDRSQFLARTGYMGYESDGHYAYDAGTEDEPLSTVARDLGDGDWWTSEAHYVTTLGGDHRVSVGGEFRRSFDQHLKTYDEFGVYLDTHKNASIWAFFGQDEVSIVPNLRLTLGLRYDHYSTFGGSTNPRVALVYSPQETTTLKLLYGRAFRAPSAFELYRDDGGFSQKTAEDLRPETIEMFEAGIEQRLGPHWRGLVTAFHHRTRYLITPVTDPADGLIVYKNEGDVRAWGFEGELEARWPSGVQGRMSYTYQHSEDPQDGEGLVNSPRHLAKVNGMVPLWGEHLLAGIEEQLTSSRTTVKGGTAGGFAVTNLTLLSRGLLDGLEVSGSVYNLFDRAYADPADDQRVQDVIPQDGRTFRLKATYAF